MSATGEKSKAEKPSKPPHAQKHVPRAPRTCRDFLEEWGLKIRFIDENYELDFSFRDNAITITDMRTPSAQRTSVLYTVGEVAANADADGDYERRVAAFMARGGGVAR